MNGAIVQVYEFPLANRRINIRVIGSKTKARRENSDDGDLHAIQNDRLSQRRCAAPEPLSRQTVAEDGGVGADAESEGENRDRSEARRLSQRAQSVAHIVHERFEEVRAAGVAALLFDLLEAAEG